MTSRARTKARFRQSVDGAAIFEPAFVAGDYTTAAANQAIFNTLAADIAAVERAVVKLPPFPVYYTGGVNAFNCDNLVIEGCGKGPTQLIHLSTTAGGITIKPASATATVMLTRAMLRNVTLFGGMTDPTAGAALTLERIDTLDIDVEVGGSFIGIDIASCRGGTMKTKLSGASNFTSAKSGSALRRWRQVTGGYAPAEIHIAGGEARGTHATNYEYLYACDLVQACDGLFFEPQHVGFAQHGLLIDPADATTQLTGIKGSWWIDETTVAGIMQQYSGAGTYDAIIGGHDITVMHAYSGLVGVHANLYASTESNNLPTIVNPGQFEKFRGTDGKAFRFQKARNWTVKPGAEIYDVTVGVSLADAQGMRIGAGKISQGPVAGTAPSIGISIGTAADRFYVGGWEFEDCAIDISNSATGTDHFFDKIRTDNGVPLVSADGSKQLFLSDGDGFAGHYEFDIEGANDISTITAAIADKTTIILNFTTSIVVEDGTGNLSLSANFSATAGDKMVLHKRGSTFYEISRSAN